MRPRILLAEDDPLTRTLLAELLQSHGYDVLPVPDGNSAIAATKALPPALAVLDLMMPGVGGLAVLRAMRTNPVTQQTPVVILTARDDDETTWASWSGGCDYFISKPFEPEVVLSIVSRLVPTGGSNDRSN